LAVEGKKMADRSHHRIVIVGGGAGGLELACRLGRTAGRRGEAAVTLVDENLTHLWKPLLHEVAAGSLDPAVEAADYLALGRRHGFRFRLGKMEGLQREKKQIMLSAIRDQQGKELIAADTVAYDTLVLSVGSHSNDYGIDGVSENCLFLDTWFQADRFHETLLKRFLQLQYQGGSQARRRLTVAIIGAGATGVELAAELHHVAHRLRSFGLDHLPATQPIQLVLIEKSDRILAELPERVANAAARELRKRGTVIHTGATVKAISAEGITLENGDVIDAHIKAWAAGIKAPDFLKDLDGLETNRLNQLVVRPNLSTTRDEAVFAFGDCAACPQPDSDKQVPPRSQSAHQQARLLSGNLIRRIENKPLQDFVYRDYGSLIYLSRSAVGNLMGSLTGSWFVEGRLARLVYFSLYRAHQWAVHGPIRAVLMIVSDFLTRRTRPRLKLH
jgi:NADH dehydrogenase